MSSSVVMALTLSEPSYQALHGAMDPHLGCALRNPTPRRHLLDGFPVNLHASQELAMLVGQAGQDAVKVEACGNGFAMAKVENLCDIVQRDMPSRSHATKMIDELIAGDAVDPRAQGTGTIVGGAPRADGDEGFLHEILCIVDVVSPEPPLEIGAQEWGQRLQQIAIGPLVTG
jgi:hypothetical protein